MEQRHSKKVNRWTVEIGTVGQILETETAWLVYAADHANGTPLGRMTRVQQEKMLRLLIACFWLAAIVSELVVGGLRLIADRLGSGE
jgi:hypothetical protein